ncbi:TPA: phage GP46 family protein [Neisseria cinerea]
MEKELDALSGDYTGRLTDTLKNAVYIRLKTPLGSWWADGSLGSLLHLLGREKDVDRVALLARQYAEETLRPIVADGRAKSIAVRATHPADGGLVLHIRVETAAGGFDYDHHVPLA